MLGFVKVRVFGTSRYEREVRRLLSEPEQTSMQLSIASDPEAHPIIPGTGGKARWARQAKGKSGGVRVIYYYSRAAEDGTEQVADPEVYLLSIYAKNDQSDMTAADRKAAKKFVEGLKDAKKQAGKKARD
jgi:mRNA-degrading endonuclease RelE of RelBE toxin-antitoxin system